MGAPDYYKSILLYGLYNGAPVPLACDEQGRLILVMEPVSPFDKSGTVLLYDDFGAGLTKALTGAQGTLASVALDYTEAVSRGISCKLTGGSDGEQAAHLWYYIFPTLFNKLGVEFKIRWGDNVKRLYVQIQPYTGEYALKAWLRYTVADTQWELYDYGSGGWTAFLTGVSYVAAAHIFHPFKLVIDIPNVQYTRLVYPGASIDLTPYTLYRVASTSYPRTAVQLQVISDEDVNGVVYLDDIFITQDES